MRDMTESAQEDQKIVIRMDGATTPYDTTHWAGQWGGAEPPAKPDRAGVSATTGVRATPPAKTDQRGKFSLAARARRRRTIAISAGAAAVGLLLVVAIPNLDDPVPTPSLQAGLTQSLITTTVPPSSQADPASPQGQAGPIAEDPEPAIQRAESGEQAVAISRELAEARRIIETLTAQLRTQSTRNDHALAERRERTAALEQDAEAAQRKLIETSAQQRQALEQERASGVALASQLSASRQDNEALAAQLRKAVDDAAQFNQAVAAKTAQSLEQENQRSAALSEAETARRELTAATAQQRQILEQERARGAAAATQASAARKDNEALAAQLRKAVGDAAQLKQAETVRSAQILQLEQQKAAAVNEADAARQALAAATQQQRQALDQERARVTAVANQVAAMRQDNEALVAQLRKAVSEATQIKQAEAARSAQSLQLEQQRIAALAEIEAARQALTATRAELGQALEQERAHGVVLANQMSTTQQASDVLAAQLRKSQDEAGQSRQAAETTIAELRQALQQERDRTAFMASEQRVVRFGVSGPAALEPVAINQVSRQQQEVAIVEAEHPAITEAHVSQEAMRLITRASTLLGQGDIGSARIVLERATEMGSARASFMLAETYDPRILSAWGTYGTRGEVTRARELYTKAQAGGIQEAKDRAGALLQ